MVPLSPPHSPTMKLPSDIEGFIQGPKTKLPFLTTTSAFYSQVEKNPNALALRDLTTSSTCPRELTYLQLADRVQALALRLHQLGVSPGHRVPLLVKRGTGMIVGILAVLSCGAQYVPLDGGVVPDSTIRHVVKQSETNLAIVLECTAYRLRELCPDTVAVTVHDDEQVAPAPLPPSLMVDQARPNSGCYVIYTSGTTGKPKGVDVTHLNVANLVCLSPGNLGIGPGTSVASVLNISFDMAAWEVFATLCNGGTLVMRGSDWKAALSQVDVLISTPTILSKYHPTQFPRIKTVATAGEPSSESLADLWASHDVGYFNCCGPSETTIVNTVAPRHTTGQALSIGRPTPNNRLYILDENLQPVAIGEVGIMWAGGMGVSRGYVGLDEKTRELYLPDPFSEDDTKMYKTGDLGLWRPDGSIEIRGRIDDQVKVKGFRVELDGISASLATAPGILRAAALLIDGRIHGFVSPDNPAVNEGIILEHTRKLQPYYAVPSEIHMLQEFPMTPNGKIDKKQLRVMVLQKHGKPQELNSPKHSPSSSVHSHASTMVDAKAYTATTTLEVSDKLANPVYDLEKQLPDKNWDKPYRGLRHRIFIVYRVLFSLMSILNIIAVIATLATHSINKSWLATLTAINLLIAVLIRQDAVINCMYTITCSAPKSWPLGIRKRLAKIYHLGGIHSGAGVCATLWLLATTILSTINRAQRSPGADSVATLTVSWILSLTCCSLVASAWPAFRKKYHNLFESSHRFIGWTTLALFWVRTCLSVHDAHPHDYGHAIVRNAGFWMLGVATLSVASSWFWLRKVKVHSEPLSDHAIRLDFDYTVPVNGSFTRLSRRPLLEWHSFATIPVPTTDGNLKTSGPGYSLVVSNAGDWTKGTIQSRPQELWVRGIPTCGVMRIATLFNRVVIIATGSGIGPLLGHIAAPSCPTQLLWSTPNPEKTFGKAMIGTIYKSIPDAVIHDTRTQGRPNLVQMGYNMAKGFRAEAVIIIANEKITKKVVYGLETRGVPAYGAIWDS